MTRVLPSLDHERWMQRAGHNLIAGLDEAGRGSWAGPVVAAAVILPLDDPQLATQLHGVCDSKLCTPRQRAVLYDRICAHALSWSVAAIPAASIDDRGIVPATRRAMTECVAQLDPQPDALLIDALRLPSLDLPQHAMVKGDRKSLVIAAASIIAKVTRDRAMVALEEIYQGYGLAQHKGYGTAQHQHALNALGPARTHRRTFAPVAAAERTNHA